MNTLFLLDIDDTTFDSVSMLGSKAWRKYIKEAANQIDSSRNWHDIFSYELALKHPLHTVEEMTGTFIVEWQDRGFVVCGFTARERNVWYDTPKEGIDALTVKQLASVGVNFDNQSLENTYPILATAPQYFGGVFFADLESKGEYLLLLLQTTSENPVKIVFVDDKASHVESVDQVLDGLGIPHECYLYTATDAKSKSFIPSIANIQLYYFFKSEGTSFLSDDDAAAIADPEVESYLKTIIDMVKSR